MAFTMDGALQPKDEKASRNAPVFERAVGRGRLPGVERGDAEAG